MYKGKYWYGRDQVENRSAENICACYRFLRSVPYQSDEDRVRLAEQEAVDVAEAEMTS